MGTGRGKRWVVTVLAGLALAAVFGLGISWMMFSLWGDLEEVAPAAAEAAFDDAVRQAGGGTPYLEVDDAGRVTVHRELERAEPTRLSTMHVLAWQPRAGRLLTVDLPFWFVRVKMTESINLGTLTTALAGDWQQLDLQVAERDLERRGPGLVMDHRRSDGARLLVWTE